MIKIEVIQEDDIENLEVHIFIEDGLNHRLDTYEKLKNLKFMKINHHVEAQHSI